MSTPSTPWWERVQTEKARLEAEQAAMVLAELYDRAVALGLAPNRPVADVSYQATASRIDWFKDLFQNAGRHAFTGAVASAAERRAALSGLGPQRPAILDTDPGSAHPLDKLCSTPGEDGVVVSLAEALEASDELLGHPLDWDLRDPEGAA